MVASRLRMGPNSGKLFDTFRSEHRKLSTVLRSANRIDFDLAKLRTSDFERSDEELVSELVSVFEVDTSAPQLSTPEKIEPQPCPSHRGYQVFVVVLTIVDGVSDLVDFWPDEISDVQHLARDREMHTSALDPSPPGWKRSNDELRFAIHVKVDDQRKLANVGATLVEEAKRATAIVGAIATQVHREHSAVRERVLTAVRRRRSEVEIAAQVSATIPFETRKGKVGSSGNSREAGIVQPDPANESSPPPVIESDEGEGLEGDVESSSSSRRRRWDSPRRPGWSPYEILGGVVASLIAACLIWVGTSLWSDIQRGEAGEQLGQVPDSESEARQIQLGEGQFLMQDSGALWLLVPYPSGPGLARVSINPQVCLADFSREFGEPELIPSAQLLELPEFFPAGDSGNCHLVALRQLLQG